MYGAERKRGSLSMLSLRDGSGSDIETSSIGGSAEGENVSSGDAVRDRRERVEDEEEVALPRESVTDRMSEGPETISGFLL